MKKQLDIRATDDMNVAGEVRGGIAPKTLVLSRRTVAVLRVRTNTRTGHPGCKDGGTTCDRGSGVHALTPGCEQH